MKLPPFRLERYFDRYEFDAPHLLCTSDCESMTVAELLALEPGAEDQLQRLWLGYTEAPGAPALREAIAGLYDNVGPEDILVHAGAEEAIFNLMNVVLEPDDHVVVHAPYYQSLGEVARGIGARVTPWRGDPDRGWALDLDRLADLVDATTRLVVVNLPHNPTGYLPGAAFLHGLVDLSRRHGFLVFSDEVYRGLELDPDDRLPAVADLEDRAISLGVMSKTYGLAGLRIGWIATRNAAVRDGLAAFKDYTSICNSAPSELLATVALRHAAAIAARNVAIVSENLDRLDGFFARHEDLFAWERPRAGSIAFPRWLAGDVEAFCADLVQRAGVLLLPGTLYDDRSGGFRIGFGRRDMPAALEHLEAYLARRR
ncbi:aminotransferase class I/II-fold pyridoxal phosphate-dependent enzyme [bacterium]|nr:aminotransferase class I/II-fold pyridoxal phosphate-dependent enzyme [bacterium]